MTKTFLGRVTQRLRREASRFRSRSYYLTRTVKYFNVSRLHNPNCETVVIYQMGKVGSSTVKHSLNELGRAMNLYHVHALTQERLDWLQGTYRNVSRVRGRAVVHDHLVEGIYLRKKLDRGTQQRWKVITLIRDPIARNISTFFQSLDIFFPEWVKERNNAQDDLVDHVDEMIELFLSKVDHKLPLVWFDKYLKPVFDIDVYEQKFPVSKGYAIYANEHAELLLMKLEDLDHSAPTAFKEFLDIEDFELKKANISGDKVYSQAYSKFKGLIKLSDSYIDETYSSQFARHFYTQDEIEQLRAKWTR